MAENFEMSMMGELNFFLDLQVKHLDDEIFINQSKYLNETLKKYVFSYAKSAKTPMHVSAKLHVHPEGVRIHSTSYRGMIGSLLYLTASCADIFFATSMCAQFQADPKESHLTVVKRIFRIPERNG